MVPAIIFGFLVGCVMAWGFRVWILVPLTALTIIAATIANLFSGTGLLTAIEHSMLIGLSPQLGYAFGLLARGISAAMKSPRKSRAAILSNRRSINGV